MEFTSELVQQYAKSFVEDRAHKDYSILAVFLTGSIITQQDPFLEGTTDIDLVFIHIGDPETHREISPLTEDIHYDLLHHPKEKYVDRVSLRIDPWMGPMLSEAVVLYDPQHFLDLTQASVRGLYHQRENIIQRAQTLTKKARSKWFEFQSPPTNPGPPEILTYLEILDCAANGIALLNGELLTERRFLINLEHNSSRLGKPGFYPAFLGMLGAPQVDSDQLSEWIEEWEKMYKELPKQGIPPHLSPYRLSYYRKGFDHILATDQPKNILWPLLKTWSLMAGSQQENDHGYQEWKDALYQLKLLDHGFSERILALDVLLDQIENLLNNWGVLE